MHPEIEELARITQEVADLLMSVGERHWGQWLENDAELIRSSDFRGVEHVLSAFGGMGSINDLVIHQINGHTVTEAQIPAINNRLESLLSSVAEKAKKLYADEVDALRRT
jgi:hypothetical protein